MYAYILIIMLSDSAYLLAGMSQYLSLTDFSYGLHRAI